MKKDRTDQPDGDLSYRPDFARIIAKEFVVMKKPVVIGLAVVVLCRRGLPEATGGIKARRDNGPDAVWQRGYSYGES